MYEHPRHKSIGLQDTQWSINQFQDVLPLKECIFVSSVYQRKEYAYDKHPSQLSPNSFFYYNCKICDAGVTSKNVIILSGEHSAKFR